MKKVLIFGIGGFVGRYLAREFLDNGYSVCGSGIDKKEGLQEEVQYFEADLMDSDEVARLVAKVSPDIIINLAAISSVSASWGTPQTTISVNVIGGLNMLEAIRKCNLKAKVMFIGSSEEYEISDKPISEKTSLNANNPYGISKMAQEKFAEVYRERYGIKIYCVRPFNHTGTGQRDSFVLPSFCKQVAEIEKSGKPGVIKVGNLAAKRDFSNVKDVVRAYRMIVESDDCTKVFNVGSGKAYSLREILDYIVSLSSQQITVEVDPERFRPVDTSTICCDYSYIKAELGWEPEYSIFETLKELYYSYLIEL
ncbi:GDP-mannose 4,6-dehydratase [Desulfosporosinus sp. SYSU MS00001]|uniref:GDP-mannose 4,6-dehydratase n=1 Tax=Desulfosporosinus sp. SYSU MS00001 TaxID=3416284 RepID=UPI003CF3B83D